MIIVVMISVVEYLLELFPKLYVLNLRWWKVLSTADATISFLCNCYRFPQLFRFQISEKTLGLRVICLIVYR